jgi:hypothetical protein
MANPVSGQWAQNLGTNIISPDTGLPLTHREVFQAWTRLSPDRDIPFTRLYVGKRDENDAGAWTTAARVGLDSCNASELGIIVSWDEREHGVEEWDTESSDASDDAAHCDPWPDVGQWIAPVRTERHAAQHLADRFRNDLSYPGVFNTDEDLSLAGRQPDPGPGNACSFLGTAWGSWGGYVDWDPATMIDAPTRWECTLFLLGLSAVSIDNALVTQTLVDLAPRRTTSFNPTPGTTVYWMLASLATGARTQWGVVTVGADGAAKVRGLLVPREDLGRVRLTLGTSPVCPADSNADGTVDFFDYDDFVACFEGGPCPPGVSADFNADGTVDFFDYDDFVIAFEAGC